MKNEKGILLVAYVALAALMMFGCGNKPKPAYRWSAPMHVHQPMTDTVPDIYYASTPGGITSITVGKGSISTTWELHPDTVKVILQLVWSDKMGTAFYRPGFKIGEEYLLAKYKKLPKHWHVWAYQEVKP